MVISKKSSEIRDKFWKYVKGGDKKLIEPFALDELKRAKYELLPDVNSEYYGAVLDRIEELEKGDEDQKRADEKKAEFKLAKEANQISKSAKNAAWLVLAIAIISILIAIFK